MISTKSTTIKFSKRWCVYGRAAWQYYMGKATTIELLPAFLKLNAFAKKGKTRWLHLAGDKLWEMLTAEERKLVFMHLVNDTRYKRAPKAVASAVVSAVLYNAGYAYTASYPSYPIQAAIKHMSRNKLKAMLTSCVLRPAPPSQAQITRILSNLQASKPITRAWYSGRAPVFQTGDADSNSAARSNLGAIIFNCDPEHADVWRVSAF